MTQTPVIPTEFRMIPDGARPRIAGQADVKLAPPSQEQSFVNGSVSTAMGKSPRVDSQLSWSDRIGSWKARWGIGRMRYTVDPGLYALGNPGRGAPVLVTANYKMSFDRLRQALPERSAWILALDTRGINVWCAAGKGTFGTEELLRRIELSGLARVVTHRDLILPQLGAPGISAHGVKKLSGFKVTYGPIRARDLPSFLDSGMKASPEMRLKTFPFWERLVLIPIELVSALKAAVLLLLVLFLLSGVLGRAPFWPSAVGHLLFAPVLLASVFAGAVMTPLLLPWLPGRAFSVKGLYPGLLFSALLLLLSVRVETIAWMVLIPALSTYLAMNFTGASTYTSLSGVRKEMRYALPVQICAGVIGVGTWIYSLLG